MLEDLTIQEAREILPAEIPQGNRWNLSVIQAYCLRELRLFANKSSTKKIFLDGRMAKIAILDTGIDESHPELEGIVNGGINLTSPDKKDFRDKDGHGTWVAGIVCSRNRHSGIAPNTEIYVVKVADGGYHGAVEHLEMGIKWSIDNNIDIILIPRTVEGNYPDLMAICGEARKKGAYVVSSAGNCVLSPRWPAGWPAKYSLSIGSIGLGQCKQFTPQNTTHVFDSNKWPYLDFVAPGQNVISTYLNGKYIQGSGTSIAAPHAAGVLCIAVSLARQVQASISPGSVEAILKRTCFKYDTLAHGLEAKYIMNLLDSNKRLFQDEKQMMQAMFGHGLIQSKDFIVSLCEYINSKVRKIYIHE